MQEEALRSELLRRMASQGEMEDKEVRRMIATLVTQRSKETHMSLPEKEAVSRNLFDAVRRLDILETLLDDDAVTEIMVNGPSHIFVERAGKISEYPQRFSSKEKLMDVIRQIVGRCNRVINERCPITDARLPDGSRVSAVMAPVALDGPFLTIRRFPKERITVDKLLCYGTLNEEMADYLAGCIKARRSILIGGGTSAGKTTFLNAMADFIPYRERIITIEDNAELQIAGNENIVRLEAKRANMEGNVEITIRDLIRASLRMRPDRIIVGEVRGEQAIDMLQALNTGHDGSMSTIHANSCEDMIGRLEVMALLGGHDLPPAAVRRQIASGIDVLVHLKRGSDGQRRLMEIARVRSDADGRVHSERIYCFDEERETWKKLGA